MRVGIIGLGNMGEPIAARIVGGGFDTTVFDTRADPLERLRLLGAKVAASSVELGRACDVIHILVVDDSQVEALVFGNGDEPGLLSICAPNTTLVVHSTVSPATTQRIAAESAQKHVRFVDAPVSGGALGAWAGTLSLLAGGDPADVEACMPIFETYASNIVHVGAVGTAQTAKIINNLVLLVNLQALREGLLLAQRAGIDEAKMIDVLRVSSGNSWRVERWFEQKKVEETYTTGRDGISKVRLKDLMLALSEGQRLGAALPVTALVSQLIAITEQAV
jgi:3-hydroxyisobutyrate dehydrogenase-like beta-hydroxyacid dehydrogenase